MAVRLNQRIKAKTANYTVDPTQDLCGLRFTNRGAAGGVTFTLPTLNTQPEYVGLWYEFEGVADQAFTVAVSAGKAVTFNNAAATSLAASTGGQKIGALIRALWDGTSWHLNGIAVGATYTVA